MNAAELVPGSGVALDASASAPRPGVGSAPDEPGTSRPPVARAASSRPGQRGGCDTPCLACLRRSALVAGLAGRIEHARRGGGGAAARLPLLLALDDETLMRGVEADPVTVERYAAFDRDAALEAAAGAGIAAICRHDLRYPEALRVLPDAPAVVHVAGSVERFLRLTSPQQPAVAIVGARRASGYGLDVARGLARGLGAADVTVVSGMALGIDSAAHAGALDAGGPTIAVLAGGPDRPYPPSKRRLYEEIRERGCAIGELPPGTVARRWCFPARNRLIAALAGVTIVVEAMQRSGSLITAEFARDLGRDVGAVPGPVTAPLSRGPNALLADGAHVIRSSEDALDLACGVGKWHDRRATRPAVPEHLRALHSAVASGAHTAEALAEHGFAIAASLAGLAELELLGHVRRSIGGRYHVSV